jgi:MFS family permease
MKGRIQRPPTYVFKFYLYRALVRVSFTAPIWYLYVLENGVTYAGLGTVMAVWWGGLILFEIPTGYVGDRIGRRRSLLIAESATVLMYVGMAFADTIVHFLVIFLVWAAAATFRSGTASAWLYDTLKERLDEDEYTRIKGRADAYGLISSGVTAVVGGYLAEISMSLTWLVTGAVVALAVPVVYTFPREETFDDEDDETFTVLDAIPVLRERFSQPPLRAFTIYFGLVAGAYWGVNFFWQPVSANLGFETSRLGWMYAGFTAIGAAMTYKAGWLKENVGIRTYFTFAPPLLGLAFLVVTAVPVLAIPVFFLMEAVFRVSGPLGTQFINDQVESVGRAIVLSAAGMVRQLLVIPFQFGAGVLADVISPTETIGLFGGLLFAGAMALVLLTRPFDVSPGGKATAEVGVD